MKKAKIIAGLVLVLGILAPMVRAELPGITFYNEADEAYALSVKYSGDSDNATIICTTQTIAVADGTVTNTIALTNTMAYTLGDLQDSTNSAGNRNFTFDYYSSLSTDSLSNKLLAGVATLDVKDGKVYRTAKIDTSYSKTYDVTRSPVKLANGISGSAAATLTGITGNITGTGDATISVYVDGDKMWENVEQSPVFSTEDGSIFTTNAIVNLNKEVNMRIGKGKRVHVRATRATTATTGGLGAVFTQ